MPIQTQEDAADLPDGPDGAGFGNLDADRTALLYVEGEVAIAEQERALFALASERRMQGDMPFAGFAGLLLKLAGIAEAQLFQDIFALFVTDERQGGYFVEIGTGDGKTISNTYLLEDRYGWNGIVVEPNPDFLPSLRRHRRCTISTDCILDISGREVTFECAGQPEFSAVAPADVGTPAMDRIHDAMLDKDVRPIRLVTSSLNDLLERAAPSQAIDYLSIDVEGAEFMVLKTFDFGHWRPKCITVEHNWSTVRSDLRELLESHGYIRVFEHFSRWDDWFVDGALFAGRPAWTEILRTSPAAPAPIDPELFVERAREALLRGELAVARTLCEAALDADPATHAAYRTLAEIAQDEQRPDAAIANWQAAIDHNENEVWARIALADLVARRGSRAHQLRLLAEAWDLASASPEQQMMIQDRLESSHASIEEARDLTASAIKPDLVGTSGSKD